VEHPAAVLEPALPLQLVALDDFHRALRSNQTIKLDPDTARVKVG
jgi:hypothetical protein